MKTLTVYFDGKEIGKATSVKEAKKMIQKRTNFSVRKYANYSWDKFPISGREMGGNFREFEII